MDRYNETFETWNKVAALYQQKFMYLDIYNDSYDFFCNLIANPQATILEIGCGPGNITHYLLNKNPHFYIYGIDVASEMIALARANNPRATFDVMDCRKISQLSKQFNAVVCGFCLPYLSQSDIDKLMIDVSNLLVNDGVFYLSFVEGNPEKSDYQYSSTGLRTYFYYHSLNDIKIILAKNGFVEEVTLRVDYEKNDDTIEQHTILIFRKK